MTSNPFLIFCLGFVSGAVPFMAFIVFYYVRAKRRVASIQAAIRRYQESSRAVGAATNAVFGKDSGRG